MRAVRQPDRARRARDLFHRHHVREIAHPAAAVFAGHRQAEQAHLAELRPQVLREDDCRGRSASRAARSRPSAKRRTASRSASMSSPSGKARIVSPGRSGHRVVAIARRGARPRRFHHYLVSAHPAEEAGRGAAHRQLELADRGDALLGQAVGGPVGRDAVALGDLVDAAEVVVDRRASCASRARGCSRRSPARRSSRRRR